MGVPEGGMRCARICALDLTDVARGVSLPDAGAPEPEMSKQEKETERFESDAVIMESLRLLRSVDSESLSTKDGFVGMELETREGSFLEALLRHDPSALDVHPRQRSDPIEASVSEDVEDKNEDEEGTEWFERREQEAPKPLSPLKKASSRKASRTSAPERVDYVARLLALLSESDREPQNMEEEGDGSKEVGTSEESFNHLKDIQSIIHGLKEQGKLLSVSPDALVELSDVLLKYVALGEFRLIDDLDNETSSSSYETFASLDASMALLRLLATKGMAKQLYREETIDSVVLLVRHHAIKHVLPWTDPSSLRLLQQDVNQESGSATKKGKKLDTLPEMPPVACRILEKLTAMVATLEELVLVERLHDHLLLQILKTMFQLLSAQGLAVLKNKAANLVRTVFYDYRKHRAFIMEEVVSLFFKGQWGRRQELFFEVPEMDGLQIQLVSSLLLQLVQVAPPVPGLHEGSLVGESLGDPLFPAVEWSLAFWQEVFRQWQTFKSQEVDVRALIDSLLHDLLAVHPLPEWPAASLLLQTFCQVIGGENGLQNTDSTVRLACTDALGQIIAHLKTLSNSTNKGECGRWDNVIKSRIALMENGSVDGEERIDNLEDLLGAAPALMYRFHGPDLSFDLLDAWQHALVMYLGRLGSTGGLINMSARNFYTHRLFAESKNFKNKVNIDEAICLLNCETSGNHIHISRKAAIDISCMVALQQPLAVNCDSILLKWLIGMCDRMNQAPNIRVRGLRSLGLLIEADPDVLAHSGVQLTIETSFKDDSISVREAALELLGRYAVHVPKHAERYFSTIASCIDDVGVSVRKRALRILREFCTSASAGFTHATDALACIISKIHDREEGVQDLVLKSFCDFVFPDILAGHDRCETSECQRFMDIVQEVYKKESGEVLIKLPLVKESQIVTVLSRLLQTDIKNIDAKTINHRLHNIARQLVRLAIKEEAAAVEGQGCVLWPFMSLHALSTANPVLCMPESDPSAFLVSLLPYAQALDPLVHGTPGKGNSEHQRLVVAKLLCLVSIFNCLLPRLSGLPPNLAAELDKAMRTHLTNERIAYTQVVVSCAQCLCSLAKLDPGTAETVMYLVSRYVSVLRELLQQDPGCSNPKTHTFRIQRALYALGHLCRFGMGSEGWEGNLQLAASKRGDPVSMEEILSLVCSFMELKNVKIKSFGLQAMGCLCISRPHLLMTEKTHSIMSSCLGVSSPFILQERALKNLTEFMRFEEDTLIETQDAEMKRQEIYRKRKRSQQLAQCAGQGDSTLSSGVAQRYWNEVLELITLPHLQKPSEPLGAPINAQIRYRALELAEVILRQGLVHPMTVFPQLIALSGDPNRGVRFHAVALLAQETEKHPEFFELRLSDGMRMSWKFQSALRECWKDHGCMPGLERKSASGLITADVVAGFNQIYMLISKQRSSRNRFLSCLLQPFDRFGDVSRGNLGSPSTPRSPAGTGHGAVDNLSFLAFCADVLANLTFCKLDEPLFCMHKINGILSLKAPMVLSSLQSSLGSVGKSLKSPLEGGTTSGNEEGHPSTPVKKEGSEFLQPTQSMKSECDKAIAASVLLLLKRYLKVAFNLSDDRILSYNPHDAGRKEDRVPVATSKVDSFSVFKLKLEAKDSMLSIIEVYQIFKDLMKNDSCDYSSLPSMKRGKRGIAVDPSLDTPTKEESSGLSSVTAGQLTPLSDVRSPRRPRIQPSRLSKSSVRRRLIESESEEESWQDSEVDEQDTPRKSKNRTRA